MSRAALKTRHEPIGRNAPVERLAAIWRRILHTADVTENSDFFDLGGDSLLAVSLFLEIERETGRNLPITAIYDAPTIAELAALMESEAEPEFSPLVLLKPGDDSAPLYIFHGVGGTVIEFAALGKLIDIPGKVFAVQAQGIDGTLPPLDSVPEMADLYCTAIRKQQPNGPYWLCGYSFGGVLAVEVAKRLEAAGEKVAMVFCIDSYAHPLTWPKRSQMEYRIRRSLRRVRSALKHSPPEIVAAVGAKLARKWRQSSHEPANDAGMKPRNAGLRQWLLDATPDLPLPLLQTRMAGSAALLKFVPTYFPGKVIFLKARTPDPDFPSNPKPVWRNLAKELELYTAPGSHMTIIGHHASDVAVRINTCMAKARAEVS
ncbi:MAG TPA: thioesterase domain-containing protein [Rhizomicrobium sp.]|jgi:thioesterase domain-containing protein/acyl carrier protein